MMSISRRSLLGALPLLASGANAQSPTDDWPKHPIRFIVSSAPGSAGDVVCRIVAQKLGERLGQQFVMDNRPAVGGTLAAEALARSAPDGYTIGMVTTSTHVIAKIFDPTLPFDPVKDFVPISMIGSSPYVLAVYPELAAKTVADLVALAKSQKQTINNAAYGTTTLGYLASLLVRATHRHRAQSDRVPLIRRGRGRRDAGTRRNAVQYFAARRAAHSGRQIARARDHRRASRCAPAGRPDARRARTDGLRCGAVDRHRRAGRHAAGHCRKAQSRNDRNPELRRRPEKRWSFRISLPSPPRPTISPAASAATSKFGKMWWRRPIRRNRAE